MRKYPVGVIALLVFTFTSLGLAPDSVSGGSGPSGVGSPRTTTASVGCSKATARRLVEQHSLNGFLLPNPVRQVLCGPFTGPGSEAMAVTIGAPTCWGIQRWALLTFTRGAWRLVLDQPAYLIPPLVAVGSDIRETTAVHRPGDSRCFPSGGTRTRIWHWNGSRLVAGRWRQVTKAKPGLLKPFRFDSPSRNIHCWMFDGGGNYSPGVGCKSDTPRQMVNLNADGRLKIGGIPAAWCGCDEPDFAPLAYGRQITVGRFRCESLVTGVRCTVVRSGKGFLINRDGISRLGP